MSEAIIGNLPKFDYTSQLLSDVAIRRKNHMSKPTECEVGIRGEWYATTERFWTSLFARYGFTKSIYNYFDHKEVTDRICQKHPGTALSFCTERDHKRALAVSSVGRKVLGPDELMGIYKECGGEDIVYFNGIVSSMHKPVANANRSKIGPDEFFNCYALEIPIDGYGDPNIYLSLLREICENGAVAYAPAFKSNVKVGDNPRYSIVRALQAFDSDEGYSALRQRFEAAQASPASLFECLTLHRTIRKRFDPSSVVYKAYDKVVGDVYKHYGMGNFDAVPDKKLHLLPAKCQVYDLINLASETATHHSKNPGEARAMNAWLGTIISDEYDLEGTSTKKLDFDSKFIAQA